MGDTPKNGADGWLTTGEMARLSQTTLRTVRFYESEGLIASRERDGGTHRKFPPSELRKLQIIADLREAGLSLQDIKALIALKGGCPTAETAACKVSAALDTQIQELERRSATLQRVRRELLSFVGVLRVCQVCEHPDFPARCRDCGLVDEPEAARATQLLWKN